VIGVGLPAAIDRELVWSRYQYLEWFYLQWCVKPHQFRRYAARC